MLESEAQKAKFAKDFPIYPNHKKYEPADNHQNLHKIFVPPAYLTQAGQTYTGMPFTATKVSVNNKMAATA